MLTLGVCVWLSMGLDSECDVFIDCERPGNAKAQSAIAGLRHSLLAELAQRQTFDPEEPEDLFEIRAPRHGLFREGSLLARARRKLSRKKTAND